MLCQAIVIILHGLVQIHDVGRVEAVDNCWSICSSLEEPTENDGAETVDEDIDFVAAK
jgi:hypothetical protein